MPAGSPKCSQSLFLTLRNNHNKSCKMTTYWKSQDRKYCEFCKCWFADNKVSISFHENGKRHKENVKKHISKLSKKSAKDFKKQEKMEDDMKKMEAAAMSAYLKDVQNNADLTSQSINELLANSGSTSKDIVVACDTIIKETPVWQEIKSDDGNIYYWNTETNETTWDPPDNYLSLAQQEKKKLKEKEEQKRDKILKKEKEKEAIIEVKAHMARESMREFAVEKEKPIPYTVPFGPAPLVKPFGTWKPVVKEPEKLLLIFAASLLVSSVVAKPQVLYDYGYYAPAYVSSYSAPLAYTYPYAYAYSYPLAYI
ncbi:jg17440 [Pararge aegeria aegeria]|uniref:Jg17440 protein n=1 Tax=Pararge aegeria aegeria TaxID=348720 RepID=A0A8S4S0V4_9NEOP|nr:jg17440 [Pararge aegeria aegeria]